MKAPLDLLFTFKSFDRRICVGSDYPDYSPKQLDRWKNF